MKYRVVVLILAFVASSALYLLKTKPLPSIDHSKLLKKAVDLRVEKLRVLDQILRDQDDNDPRIDSDFKDLSAAEKKAIRDLYFEKPAEERKVRAMIVEILGQNLTSEEDFDFMKAVLLEAPCMSLRDCAKADEAKEEITNDEQMLLAAPQWMALPALEVFLEKKENSIELKQKALATLKAALASRIDGVSKRADEIGKGFNSL